MEQLPQEIINLIVTFIESYHDQPGVPWWKRKASPSNFAGYAIVSSTWKHAIESIVFQNITLQNTDIEAFDAIFKGDRRRFLTKLTLHVVLPNFDDKFCDHFERKIDKNASNEVFTKTIEKLFAVLKSWEENGSVEGNIRFALWKIYAPIDVDQRDYETHKRHRFETMIEQRRDLFEHHYRHSLIRLLRPDQLPSLRRISEADFGGSTSGRNLNMRVLVDMIVKLPCLESLNFTLYDNEKNYPKIRVANRHSFAFGLSACTFPFL